jgi:hypothetical protein
MLVGRRGAAGARALVALTSALLISASSSSSSPLPPRLTCGLVMNDTTAEFTFAAIQNGTGTIQTLASLPSLDEYGFGISAGATRGGLYFTVSGNVSEQEDLYVVNVLKGTGVLVPIVLPPAFSFLSLYGVGALDVVPGSELPVALILGFASDDRRYAFVGELDPASGAITRVLANLTDSYRTWVYLYAGISAYDANASLYYLSVVLGEHDITTLVGFNVSAAAAGPDGNAPMPISVPYNGLGDFMALAVAPKLAQAAGGRGQGLLALVDDDENTAAALWLLTDPQQNATAPWTKLYQYDPNTLESGGANDMLLAPDGVTALSVFYDTHYPVANQIVSAVNLALVPAREVGRTAVEGSQQGTSISDIAACPAPA